MASAFIGLQWNHTSLQPSMICFIVFAYFFLKNSGPPVAEVDPPQFRPVVRPLASHYGDTSLCYGGWVSFRGCTPRRRQLVVPLYPPPPPPTHLERSNNEKSTMRWSLVKIPRISQHFERALDSSSGSWSEIRWKEVHLEKKMGFNLRRKSNYVIDFGGTMRVEKKDSCKQTLSGFRWEQRRLCINQVNPIEKQERGESLGRNAHQSNRVDRCATGSPFE